MEEETIYYKRNLPHYHTKGAIYFVTFRLAGSLPKQVVYELKLENENIEKMIKQGKNPDSRKRLLLNHRKRYFQKFDKILDGSSSGSLWLRNEKIAKIVSDAIRYRNGKYYILYAYCIMPNHVHMLISVTRNAVSSSPDSVRTYTLTKVLQDLKKFTAIRSNKILNHTGQFWHHESYDHVVRDEKEFYNILNYIVQNPVKAGFVKDWEDWRWSYVNKQIFDL